MSSPKEANPFTLAYDTMWEMTASQPEFKDIVRLGNRISFATPARDPIKQSVMAADLPEVVLVSNGFGAINLGATSSTTMITRKYSWLMSTGDLRLHELLYPLQFAVIRACARWAEHLGQLKWKGKTFIKRFSLSSISEGQSDKNLNRGIEGWSSIIVGDAEMHFVTKDLMET